MNWELDHDHLPDCLNYSIHKWYVPCTCYACLPKRGMISLHLSTWRMRYFSQQASHGNMVQPHWSLFRRAVCNMCSKLFKYITYEHFYWRNKENVDAYQDVLNKPQQRCWQAKIKCGMVQNRYSRRIRTY